LAVSARPVKLGVDGHYLAVHGAQGLGRVAAAPDLGLGAVLGHFWPSPERFDLFLGTQHSQGEIIHAHPHQAAVLHPRPGMAMVIIVIPGHIEAGGVVAHRFAQRRESAVVFQHLVVGTAHAVITVPAQLIGHPAAEHVTAFSLVDQHAQADRPGISRRLFGGMTPGFKVGLNLAVESATETIKGIDAGNGFTTPARLQTH
jgi:hypothetical protein